MARKGLIQFGGNAVTAFRKATREADKAIQQGLRRAAMRVVREAKINVKQKLNTTGTSRGTLGRSITAIFPSKYVAHVGPSVIYGRIHELGGVIRPVNARMLAIPIGDRTGSAREHDDLTFIGSGNKGCLVDSGGKPQFALVSSVTIPARPYLAPALEKSKTKIAGDFEVSLRTLVGG